MDDLPTELHVRRHEIHTKVVRRARSLRHRRAAAVIAAMAIVVAIPTAAIALNSGGNSPGRARVAVSGDPATEPAATSSTDAATTTTEATTTVPPPPNSTATTTVTQPAETSTTSVVCHNSMDPACGPLHYDQPIANQPATLIVVKVSPTTATAGEPVRFTLHVTDPDSRIEATDMWCNGGGYTFGDNSTTTVCDALCAPSVGYGPWDPPVAQPTDLTFTLDHTYVKAGTYNASFKITVGLCGPRPSVTSTAITVTVTATPPTS